jgi:hypothetical protein
MPQLIITTYGNTRTLDTPFEKELQTREQQLIKQGLDENDRIILLIEHIRRTLVSDPGQHPPVPSLAEVAEFNAKHIEDIKRIFERCLGRSFQLVPKL